MTYRLMQLLLTFMIALYVLLLAMSIAHAHDHDRADLNKWFEGLKNRKNGSCCLDRSEALKLADPDWRATSDGHYEVLLDGQWIVVPDDAVVDGPNLEGPTLVWPTRGYLGTSVRCFLPGSGA